VRVAYRIKVHRIAKDRAQRIDVERVELVGRKQPSHEIELDEGCRALRVPVRGTLPVVVISSATCVGQYLGHRRVWRLHLRGAGKTSRQGRSHGNDLRNTRNPGEEGLRQEQDGPSHSRAGRARQDVFLKSPARVKRPLTHLSTRSTACGRAPNSQEQRREATDGEGGST
jgi:hypothetical protein